MKQQISSVLRLDVKLPLNNSYLRSYPALIEHCENSELRFDDIICLIHMVYGWMPTIPTLYYSTEKPEEIVRIIIQSRSQVLSIPEIETLKKFINNSLVGVSKLLHFIAPNTYPIWDSKVVSFIFGKASAQNVGSAVLYLEFLEAIHTLKHESEFKQLYARINESLINHYGYTKNISAVRAIELMMFLNSERPFHAELNQEN